MTKTQEEIKAATERFRKGSAIMKSLSEADCIAVLEDGMRKGKIRIPLKIDPNSKKYKSAMELLED
jgi:hypothetical protein